MVAILFYFTPNKAPESPVCTRTLLVIVNCHSQFLERLRGDGWIGFHDDIGDESFTYLDEGLPVRGFSHRKDLNPSKCLFTFNFLYNFSSTSPSAYRSLIT